MPIDARQPPGDPFTDPVRALRSQLAACQRSVQALKNSELKYRTIFQKSANPMAITTLNEGRFIEVNEGFTHLTGYAGQEVVGRTSLGVGLWKAPAHRTELLERLLKQGGLENEEVALKTKAGETRIVILSARLMEIDDEYWVVSSVQDITARKTAELAPPQTKTGTRVLFVDDHRVIRQGLIRLVAGQPDIQVAGEAANGQEAIELAQRLRPDVVVMDISMPVMDGFEATRRIRGDLPHIRVIGLSMHDDPQIARKMIDAGAEALVSKASSSSELIKAIYGLPGATAGPRAACPPQSDG